MVRSACVILSILNEKTGGQRWGWGEGYPESLALRVADIVASALIENPDLKFHEVWPRVQEAICDGEKIRAEAFELPQAQTKDPGK